MRYVASLLVAFLLSLVIGAVGGAWEAIGALAPSERATLIASGISCAMNTAAFYALILVPLALALTFVLGRLRRRTRPQRGS